MDQPPRDGASPLQATTASVDRRANQQQHAIASVVGEEVTHLHGPFTRSKNKDWLAGCCLSRRMDKTKHAMGVGFLYWRREPSTIPSIDSAWFVGYFC
jgi:hypothetical protein